jgi:hypothetical protein
MGSAGFEPAFEVTAVNDAEDEEDLVGRDKVVHHAVVADAEAVEGVSLAADRLDLLAADPVGSGCCLGEVFEVGADPRLQGRRQLPEDALRGWSKSNLVTVAQAISRSGVERPRR